MIQLIMGILAWSIVGIFLLLLIAGRLVQAHHDTNHVYLAPVHHQAGCVWCAHPRSNWRHHGAHKHRGALYLTLLHLSQGDFAGDQQGPSWADQQFGETEDHQ